MQAIHERGSHLIAHRHHGSDNTNCAHRHQAAGQAEQLVGTGRRTSA
jgi:hypothetical protein